MKFFKIIAYPFSILYGCIIYLRNKFFDIGILPETEFKVPVISIGNLVTGGTGKTPHTEYLIRLLQSKYTVATLSRGYGRSTSGFVLASDKSTSLDIGDEPKQFQKKFPDVKVAVDGQRVRGIKRLLENFPDLDVVLLDDAFQHRYVKPGVSILLTDYGHLFYKDLMLPSGNLREFISGYKRADIIIVTKTPEIFSPLERRIILREINPEPYQSVYFSYIKSGNFIPLLRGKKSNVFAKEFYFERNFTILLITGIADSDPFEAYLKSKVKKLTTIKFSDHHDYTMAEIMKIKTVFEEIKDENKIIVTTEKDAMRLENPGTIDLLMNLPVFYLTIEVLFHDNGTEDFDKKILDYVKGNEVKRITSTSEGEMDYTKPN